MSVGAGWDEVAAPCVRPAQSRPQMCDSPPGIFIPSVADPDPGSGIGCFLTPGSGNRHGRKSASGSGIRDEQPGSYFLELRNNFFAFFEVEILNSLKRIRDPGWRQFGSGIRDGKKSEPPGIRDKHPGSATLFIPVLWIRDILVRIWIRGSRYH
jgi:hypothetical protein